MLRHGSGRATARFFVLVAGVGTLASCRAPADLDRQQQVGFARACASLLERNLSDNEPPRTGTLDGELLDLGDPATFYERLHRLRGPDTFDLHDPANADDTAREPLDGCSFKPSALSSLLSKNSRSTDTETGSTTTSTTAPGT